MLPGGRPRLFDVVVTIVIAKSLVFSLMCVGSTLIAFLSFSAEDTISATDDDVFFLGIGLNLWYRYDR